MDTPPRPSPEGRETDFISGTCFYFFGPEPQTRGEALPLGILKGEALKAGCGCAAPTI